jgi:hypothetical protein
MLAAVSKSQTRNAESPKGNRMFASPVSGQTCGAVLSENQKIQILPKRIYFNRFEGKKLPAGAIQVHYGQVDGR